MGCGWRAELSVTRLQTLLLNTMALSAALISNALGFFGSKPKVPTLADVNPDLIQKETTAGNIANFADIAKLATQTNTFNQEQLEALMDRALPGVRESIQQNIGSMARGEVPKDVAAAVTRYGAQRGLGALTTGSQFSNNLTARDIGLTSLNLIDKGLSSAESWLQRAQAPQMDVSAMFFSPQQRLAAAELQQARKFDRDVMAAQVKAMPSPGEIAISRELDRMMNSFAAVGLGALGNMGGVAKDTGAFPSASQQYNMMQDYTGASNMGLNYSGTGGVGGNSGFTFGGGFGGGLGGFGR